MNPQIGVRRTPWHAALLPFTWALDLFERRLELILPGAEMGRL